MNTIGNIPVIFRAFKRYYHKVEKIHKKLVSKGDFSFKISCTKGDAVKSEFKKPDNEETMRFVVLMRRFLNPGDFLYYKSIWALLLKEFPAEISIETVKQIETLIEQLNKENIGVNISGEKLTAEKMYQIIADGQYFDDNENAKKYLQHFTGVPILEQLFQYSFHIYTLKGYALANALFGIIKSIEQTVKYQTLYSDKTPRKNKCIYCLTTTSDFTSEEHIFPESLGNDELVLPKGYVCDKCNNEVLSHLDNSLIEFEPIAMLRIQFVLYTKEGKLPSAKFQNVHVKRTDPRNITISAKDKTGGIKNEEHLPDGSIKFTTPFTGKIFDPRLLGRCLYKIALGIVAFSEGHEQACNSIYDQARVFICQNQGFPNNLIMQQEGKPNPQIRYTYERFQEGTIFMIDIYGLRFLFNLEPIPIWDLTADLVEQHFASFALYE